MSSHEMRVWDTPDEENLYSLGPHAVKHNNEEKKQLSNNVRNAIDEAFLFADHSQTLSTVEPLELFLPVSRNKTYETFTLGIPYDRMYVDAVIDHDQDPRLKSLQVKLFRSEWGQVAYTTLSAYEGDGSVDDELDVDTDNPSFTIACPQELRSGKRELIPLNYHICRELMNHVVSLANPMAAYLNDDRSLLECAEALMALSTETIVDRTAKYQFSKDPDETVEVFAQDKALVYPIGEPRHTFHEAYVKRIRSFGRAGSLATLLSMNASLDEVETTITKEFSYQDDAAEEILGRIDDVTNEHTVLTADTPEEFSRQLVDGIGMLRLAGVATEGINRIDL